MRFFLLACCFFPCALFAAGSDVKPVDPPVELPRSGCVSMGDRCSCFVGGVLRSSTQCKSSRSPLELSKFYRDPPVFPTDSISFGVRPVLRPAPVRLGQFLLEFSPYD